MPEPDVRVRPAVPSDLDRWIEVLDAVAAEGRWIGHEQPVDRQELGKRFLEAVEDPAALRLVVEADSVIVGLLSGEEYKGIVSFGMMLLGDWRGQGLGGRLLDTLVGWARSHGAHKLTLQVWPHNLAAIRLYERYGFEVEGRLRRHWRRRSGELWDALLMGRALDEEAPGEPPARPYSGM